MQVVLLQPENRVQRSWQPGCPPRRLGTLSRAALLVGASLLAYAATPAPAWAANECGPPPPGGGTVTCPAGNYPNGIDYDVVADTTVVLEPGVTTDQTVKLTSDVPGVDLSLQGPVDTNINSSESVFEFGEGVRVVANGGTVAVAVDEVHTTGGFQSQGVAVRGTGMLTVTAGTVTTTGDWSQGINGYVENGDVVIDATNIATTGVFSDGIFGFAEHGDVVIDSMTVTTTGLLATGIETFVYDGGIFIESGSVTTGGDSAAGIEARAADGTISIQSDTIVTSGTFSPGILVGPNFFAPSPNAGPVFIDSGSITTTGSYSDGIDVYTGTEVTVNSDSIEAAGWGIFVQGSGNVSVTSDSVTSGGPGIYVAGNTIDILSGTVSTAGDEAHGVAAYTNQGAINITSETVSTAGAGAIGIVAQTRQSTNFLLPSLASSGGIGIAAAPVAVPPGISITSGSVATTGGGAIGISADTIVGDIFIESGSVTTEGDDAIGIRARTTIGDIFNAGNSITIDSGTVSTSGDLAHGIQASVEGDYRGPDTGGSLVIISETVTTAGNGAVGIAASTSGSTHYDSSIHIESGSITIGGSDSLGISASSGDGNIHIGSGLITAVNGSNGIQASNGQGYIGIGSDTIVVSGSGISAFSNGGGIGISSGSITSGGPAISAGNATQPGNPYDFPGGGIGISSGSIVTQGGGISASSDFFVFVSSNSIEGGGISVETVFPFYSPFNIVGAIGVYSGSIVTGGTGISVLQRALGRIYISSDSIVTSGDGAPGIASDQQFIGFGPDISTVIDSGSIVTAGEGSVGIKAGGTVQDIIIDSGSVTTAGTGATGILAYSHGSVAIDSGTVATNGAGAAGIDAYGHDVTVTSSSVTTAGDYATGILASGANVASVDSGSVVTAGVGSIGIKAASDYGGVTIDSASVATSGAAATGIDAGSATGDIQVTSDSVTTAGDYASGIFARTSSSDGDGVTDIASNTVATTGDGSRGISAYGASVVVHSTSVTTGGFNADGIYARSFGLRPAAAGIVIQAVGPGGTSVTSGSVTTAGDDSPGIYAVSDTGDTEVISTGTVATAGDDSAGIIASGATVTVTSATVTTTGDGSAGIIAASFGTDGGGGDALGSLSAGGDLIAQAVGPGGTSVTSGSVTTTGDDSPGIEAHSAYGDTEVISTGTVATGGANSPGILADSATGFVAVDANAVTASGAGSDAIRVDSATTSDVIIRGLVQSAQAFALQADGGAATVAVLAGGTLRGRIDLTDGDDTVVNDGLFDVIGTSQFGGGGDIWDDNAGSIIRSVNGAGALAGLETFNNRGLVEMRDGATGDSLAISGTFNGLAGSRLGVDVDFTAGTADVLVLGPATGTTIVDVNGSGDPDAFNPTGILVVDASAGTGANAFVLPGGNVSNIYVRRGLFFDAANFDFRLISAPQQPVFETVKVGELATNLWHKSADAVGAQLDTSRDGGAAGTSGNALRGEGGAGLWVQAMTGESEQESVQSFTVGGAAQSFDLSYEQDFEGLQGGVELGSRALRFGLTGGIGKGDTIFDVTGDRLEMDVKNIGAYAEFRSGGLWLNGLVKMDWIDLETQPGAGLAAEFDARSFGGLVSLGYRAELGDFFLEPSAGIAWVRTEIDSYQSGGATVDFDDSESLRAQAGLRAGAVIELGETSTLAPYVGLRAFDELADGNTNRFTLGSTLALADDSPGTHGRAEAGFSLHAGSLEAFVRGELDFGGDTEGKSLRAGLRLRF